MADDAPDETPKIIATSCTPAGAEAFYAEAFYAAAFQQRALFADMEFRRRTSYHIDPRDGMAVLDD